MVRHLIIGFLHAIMKSLFFLKSSAFQSFFLGLILPLSFAPFHLSGLVFLSLALFFIRLHNLRPKAAFYSGFWYGLGFFSLGVSWIYVSIHLYGHLHPIIAAFITFLFLAYLSLFPALSALLFSILAPKRSNLHQAFLFSLTWFVFESLRGVLFGGFPWLSLGFSQMDTPLQSLYPLIGLQAVGWLTVWIATILGLYLQSIRTGKHHASWQFLVSFIALLLCPYLFQSHSWSKPHAPALSVAVIQPNISMRDKWDEHVFSNLLDHYMAQIKQLIPTTDLIILPESSIPIPSSYIGDILETLDEQARQNDHAILLGIPTPTQRSPDYYHNSMLALGHAEGLYAKQHLVAFGEFLPHLFEGLQRWIDFPPNLKPGLKYQPNIYIKNHPIASLICYELAFPLLLRSQLPQAEWIVSISDDGWFGRSLAIFQHIQMAQVLSKQTSREQIVANNDGLSSLIDADGHIIQSLSMHQSGQLKVHITPRYGMTPWVKYGDLPLYFILFMLFSISYALPLQKKFFKQKTLASCSKSQEAVF